VLSGINLTKAGKSKNGIKIEVDDNTLQIMSIVNSNRRKYFKTHRIKCEMLKMPTNLQGISSAGG
jgi:hypothetical protein